MLEIDSSLGSQKPEVSLYANFEPPYQSRSDLQDVEPLPSLEQESSLSTSLSAGIAPYTSSAEDVTEDVLVLTHTPLLVTYVNLRWVKTLGIPGS